MAMPCCWIVPPWRGTPEQAPSGMTGGWSRPLRRPLSPFRYPTLAAAAPPSAAASPNHLLPSCHAALHAEPHRRPGPPGHAAAQPRRNRNPDLHAGGHLRRRQGHVAGRPGGGGRAHHSGQHLPPVAASRHDRDGEAGRAAWLQRLAPSHPDRFGRLPGLEPGGSAQDLGRRRALCLAHQWRQAVPDARGLDAGAAGAELGHRHGVR